METSVTNQIEPLAVDVKETARLTGLSPFTIRLYERRGLIKGSRIGRRVVIPMSEIERIVRDGLIISR